MTPDENEIRMPERSSRRQRASGEQPTRGRQREVDVDELGLYETISLSLSRRSRANLRIAVAYNGGNQNAYLLRIVVPAINASLKEQGIDPETGEPFVRQQ